MLTYVFPGQGSQSKGMGQEYFDEFKDLVDEADSILGYSIRKLCIEDAENQLGLTQYTQPALYVVNALSYLKKVQDTGIKPDYVAGHSLGEYNALFAAEVFDFGTGLKLVKKRGELMAQSTGGGMAAIIGMDEETVREVMKKNNLDSIDIANLNTSQQIVISGMKSDIENAQSIFTGAGAMNYVILKVSGAFHSRYMENAQKVFDEYTKQFEFHAPKIPVISNVYARPYKNGEIRNYLIKQMTSSVKWTESIRYLMGKGDGDIIQIGPGNVLTGMVRKIKRESEPLYVEKEEEELSTKNSEDTSKPESKEVFTAETLGSKSFKEDYRLKYAYLTGGMNLGISGRELVKKIGQAGMMGFYGTEGLERDEIEDSITWLKKELNHGEAYGMNLVSNQRNPEKEEEMIDLFLKHDIRIVEASAYISITPALIRYRLHGIKRDTSGKVVAENKIIAKTSRPEVAKVFLSPASSNIVERLLSEHKITYLEAELSKELPIAEDVCVEMDSAGYSVKGVASTLLPTIIRLKNEMIHTYGYKKDIRVGMAGGIGTPEAIASAFVMGADFVMTGSINQCTVQAENSDVVKDMLQELNVQDTEYVPNGEMFEYGAKTQVMKRGVLFPVRANKLYDVYRMNNSISEIDEITKKQIQEKYFNRSFESIYSEIKQAYPQSEIDMAEKNAKYKMTLIFRWYFRYAKKIALLGDADKVIDYQVNCGPSLGAFNQWVKGTALEKWRNRNVDDIGRKLMTEAAAILNDFMK